ncbi:MAG TPA: hypothetical protein VKE74_27780 [Gemmataceae bacterium]|nr:hypothetical protein [Gemmataceae bacterium]
MTDTRPGRGWLLPVLLAVAIAAASGFAFLYFTRPNPGELGAVRVVVAEDGKAGDGNALHVFVGEAPLVQKETVSPGREWRGVVHYPIPYRLLPNLKLSSGTRKYEVVKQDETGFAWIARLLPDDFTEEARKGPDADRLVELSFDLQSTFGKLRPGLVYEDFTWEAKGLRAAISAIPPKPFEQSGTFTVIHGQDGVVGFPIPYAGPPNVELSGPRGDRVAIIECAATHFKWRNTAKEAFANDGEAKWTARGILATGGEPKK